MGPIMTICLIVIVFAAVMLLGLFAVTMIGRSWGGDRQNRRDLTRERIAEDDRAIDSGRAGRAEQSVALAGVSEFRVTASAMAMHVADSGYERRSREIVDALAASPAPSSARLGQSYQRSQRPHVRRGEEG